MTTTQAEQRSSPRRPVSARGYIYVAERGHPCEIVDVSSSGCQVVCSRPLELPGQLEVHLIGQPGTRPAWVRWRRGKRVGLSFNDPTTDLGASA